MNVSDSFGTINTPEKERERKNSPWAPEKEKKVALGAPEKEKKNGAWGGKLGGTLICQKVLVQ